MDRTQYKFINWDFIYKYKNCLGANRYRMGIDGLLKFLRPITEKQHISTFKNQRAGIDIMSWIYRGCYSCTNPLKQSFNTNRYVYFILEMIQILGFYNIKPIFVFDGRSFGLKTETNQKRSKQKQQNKQKAEQLLKQGRLQQARKYFSRCIIIDEQKIQTIMNVMYTKNIQFIVAPYQADCQIAKLKRLNIIDFAISEDSDLVAYNVNTVFKINQNGDCDYIDPNKWAPRDVDQAVLKEYLSMNFLNKIEAAILAGTDYNPSIKGIGIYRAVKLLYRQAKVINVIAKLKLQKIYADKIPQNYQQLTQKVRLIFLFATVFNPITKSLQQLNPQYLQKQKPSQMPDQEFYNIVGVHYPQYLEKQVYMGKTIAKDLKPRQISPINIKQMFKINKQNMILHERNCMNRKQQQSKLKQDREQQIKQGTIRVYPMNPQGSNKNKIQSLLTPQKIAQLTEQEKQKKKQERKNRIIKLQDVMNSVFNMCEEEDEEDKKLSTIQLNQFQTLEKQLKQVTSILQKSQTQVEKRKGLQDEKQINYIVQKLSDYDQSIQKSQKSDINQQSESESFDLAFLNPFAKSIDKTGTKSDNSSSKINKKNQKKQVNT